MISSESAYAIKKLKHTTNGNDSILNTQLTFDKNHDIFKGHFPSHPVVPGVLQIEVIKHIIEEHLGLPVKLIGGKSIKFMAFINPTVISVLDCNLTISPQSDHHYEIKGSISNEHLTFLIFKGVVVKA